MTTNGNRVHDNISINDRNTTAPYGIVSVVCAPTTDTQVYRNTIVTEHADTAMVSDNGPTGVTFRDNIFVGSPSPGGTPFRDIVSTYSGNLYWHTSQDRDTAAVNADPLFRSADPHGPHDVRLRAGSPARGAGSVTGGGPDYFGNRVSDPPSIGADQSR